MKRYLSITLVSLLFVLPFTSYAQTTDTTTYSPQYVSLLKEMLALLEQELQIILATQSTVSNIATTTSAIQSTITQAAVTNPGTGSSASNQAPVSTPAPAPTYTTATLTPDASPSTAAGAVGLENGGDGTAQVGTFSLTFNLTDAGLPAYINFRSNPVVITLHDQTKGTSEVASSTAITMDAPIGGSYNDIDNNGDYIVNGSVKFTASASMNGGSGDFWYATLDSLNYGSSSTSPSGQTITFPSTYQTNPVLINS